MPLSVETKETNSESKPERDFSCFFLLFKFLYFTLQVVHDHESLWLCLDDLDKERYSLKVILKSDMRQKPTWWAIEY